jgi:channel protein (hemolysin III family)
MHEKAKYILRVADHISIYYLIAGTYTALLMQTIPFERIQWFFSDFMERGWQLAP